MDVSFAGCTLPEMKLMPFIAHLVDGKGVVFIDLILGRSLRAVHGLDCFTLCRLYP